MSDCQDTQRFVPMHVHRLRYMIHTRCIQLNSDYYHVSRLCHTKTCVNISHISSEPPHVNNSRQNCLSAKMFEKSYAFPGLYYLNYVFLMVIRKDFGFFEYNLEWSSSENSGSRMFFLRTFYPFRNNFLIAESCTSQNCLSFLVFDRFFSCHMIIISVLYIFRLSLHKTAVDYRTNGFTSELYRG